MAHKDRFGNPMGIKKNNVVIIHDRTYGGGLEMWGHKAGSLGLVVDWGCCMVEAEGSDRWIGFLSTFVFNEKDLEVIGTL